YSRTKYIASFAGFAPDNNPAVTIAVILDSPVGGHHGGQVGGPVFQRIAQQVLEYLHTTHDVELPSNRDVFLAQRRVKDQDLAEGGIVVPSFAGKSVRSAIEIAEESGLDLDAVGSGIAREQSPPAGSHVAAGSRVTVRFGR